MAVLPLVAWGAPRAALAAAPVVQAPTAVVPAAPSLAAEAGPAVQGTYEDWSLYSFQERGNPVCYLASRIEKSSESVPRRNPAYILITHRPAERRWGVVSIVPGYSYETGSAVTLAIGNRQFHLFTDGDAAWAPDPSDPQVVSALRTGGRATVTGHAKGGATTVDSYRLRGAVPALAALDKACPPPARPAAVRKKKAKGG